MCCTGACWAQRSQIQLEQSKFMSWHCYLASRNVLKISQRPFIDPLVDVGLQSTCGLSPSWLAWSEGWQLLGAALHLSDEPGELSHHDDSTINIVQVLLLLLLLFEDLTKPAVNMNNKLQIKQISRSYRSRVENRLILNSRHTLEAAEQHSYHKSSKQWLLSYLHVTCYSV